MKQVIPALIFLILAPGVSEGKENLQAGAAKINITSAVPIWMAGYAARNKPSEGSIQPLWAKALAISDGNGGQAVIVTTDLIGLPREVTDVVAAQAMEKYKLERGSIVFNSSHTHTGPVVRGNLSVIGAQTPEQRETVALYLDELKIKLLAVIGGALRELTPAKISFDYGETKFAVNRRQITDKGVVIGVNPNGPVDHRVPVLRVTDNKGKVRAVLFGYNCHNTTLTAEFYKLSGDYAGFAQSDLEKQFPDAVALFVQLCGGDQNPNPRSQLELAEKHGAALATEVARVAKTKMQPVTGALRAVYQTVSLPFAPHTREQYERDLKDSNKYKVMRAEMMLKQYDERREVRQLQYPVQAVRFEKGFTLIALGGEVVVDYGLWAQKEFPAERMMVAGYSNDVACYIPTARILKEGGYEAVDSMIYYGQPGPFTEEVETRIQEGVRQVLARVSK